MIMRSTLMNSINTNQPKLTITAADINATALEPEDEGKCQAHLYTKSIERFDAINGREILNLVSSRTQEEVLLQAEKEEEQEQEFLAKNGQADGQQPREKVDRRQLYQQLAHDLPNMICKTMVVLIAKETRQVDAAMASLPK